MFGKSFILYPVFIVFSLGVMQQRKIHNNIHKTKVSIYLSNLPYLLIMQALYSTMIYEIYIDIYMTSSRNFKNSFLHVYIGKPKGLASLSEKHNFNCSKGENDVDPMDIVFALQA